MALGATVRMLIRGVTTAAIDGDVHVDTLDVSSLAAVRAVRLRRSAVHALIHNAGVMPERDRDRRGPRARARDARPRPAPADPAAAAGAGDLGLVGRDVHAEAARRRPRVPRRRVQRHDGVRAHEADAGRAGRSCGRARCARTSGHPGWVDTPGIAHSLPKFERVARPILRTTQQGADTFVWLAAADVPLRPLLARPPPAADALPALHARIRGRPARPVGLRGGIRHACLSAAADVRRQAPRSRRTGRADARGGRALRARAGQ